jgi:hypothetical protein
VKDVEPGLIPVLRCTTEKLDSPVVGGSEAHDHTAEQVINVGWVRCECRPSCPRGLGQAGSRATRALKKAEDAPVSNRRVEAIRDATQGFIVARLQELPD